MHEIGRLARLELGYVGETNSRVIEIDVSEWLERWPDAIIVAWHERPDKYGYWANTSEEDGILSWTVHSGDVAVAGEGYLQVRAIMPKGDGKIYKSRVVRTRTYASLEEWMNDPDAPDPMEAWANVAAVARAEAVAARDEAEQHAYRAEESATMAEVAKDATLSYQDATYVFMERAERAAESADQAQETTAQIAATAGEAANIATESATEAINSMIEAKEAAEQASEDADTAAAAKKTAVEAAEQAKISEENSRKTASDASRGMANNNVIMDALVPYWGDNAVIEIGRPNYPAENIGVVRNGGTVLLNGTAGAMVRITMSGELAVTATNADFEALERTVDFFDGRVYELEMRNLSGTMTGDDLRCIVYKEGVEDPVGYAVYNPAVGKGVTRFTWDGVGSDGIVALRVPAGMTFEDCEMCVVITDVAARAEATADATAREGVAANVQAIKELKAKQTEDHTDVTTMIDSVADDVTPRVTEADRVTKNTDGHFWPILWTAATKITTYTETDGVITEHTDKPLGSAIIPCPRNLVFDFENGTARIYLYFYTKNDDGSFTPNWDIVNQTASTGLKNYINSGQYGKTAIRDIPDGMYMQAAVPVGNVQLYGWDGEAFGPPLTTNANTVTSSGNTNSMMADGNGSVIIPGDAQYVITTDPKATLRMGIGVKDGVSTYLGSSATEFIKLPTGYDYFMYRLDPNSGIKTTWTGDASKYVAAVCDMQRNRLTETAAKYVIDAARKISEFQWTPAANIRIQGGGKEYYPGVTYNGIPYGSGWQVAHYVGWHVSAHTFLNAVADDASIMVMEGLADDGNAPYYSTVCSAFATMAAGWPHPALNDEMAINPKVKLIRTVTPPIGVVWSNIGKGGGKHCVIPERVDYIGDKVESISAYEGKPAASMRTTRYSNITDAEDKTRFKQAYGANYYDTYGAAAYHLEAVRDMSNIPYWDADTATVTGGDARPYRGDRSVYTSQMDSVLINIKNANAESLLLRNPSGGTHLIKINGTTQIDVKSYMSEDGIYYVSTDTSFTEESFEYVSTEPLTYKSVNGQISFDRNDWWYVYVEFTPDRRNSYWPEKTKMVNVPCNADNDYRDWTAIGRFGKAYVAYYKGQYGAYTVPCVATEIWDEGVDDLVDKFRVGTGLSMEGRKLNADVTKTDIEELRMIINQGGGSGGGTGGIVTETDPTVPARISEHNTDEDAHNDLRLLLADLDKRLGTLADSDDTTLDQLSEIVAYIKSNKSLIDGITTGKISTADIVNNLTTNAANKPLSAAQGVALKKLIDAIVVPTKVSAFENDAGYAKRAEVAELSEEIDAINNAGYIDEATLADELAKRGQLKPEFANSIEECTDTSLLYVLPDGYIYAYILTETETTTGGYKNWLPLATETYNGSAIYGENGYVTGYRLSSSGSVSQQAGMLATGFIPASDGAVIRTVGFSATKATMGCYVITYDASGTKIKHYQWGSNETSTAGNAYIKEFTLDSTTYGTGIAFIRISASANTEATLPSIVTVNQEIKEGSTTVVKEYKWDSTGHAFVPADYEDRIIDLEEDVKALKARPVLSPIGTTVFAPSPQLPADGSETADFDAENISAAEIYAYIDALAAKYPRYLTKETLGKDESGSYDWNRYTVCRRYYDAWVKKNYPAMYAWVNGSTTVYSASVSPRVGDTMYSTAYIGTAYSTVTAVVTPNQTRTVNGLVFSRDKSKDVAPTLVFSHTIYNGNQTWIDSGYTYKIYSEGGSTIANITGIANGVLTDANGNTYNRYPMGDRDADFRKFPVIVIGSNEHGGNKDGDPAEPAIVSARLIKDLCERTHMDNTFLNLLKNQYMLVFCPLINPWGFSNNSYTNANSVNIDRNFDTPGWGNDADTRHGDYGGSENEAQFFMNTLAESNAIAALANHCYGYKTNATTGKPIYNADCAFMPGRMNEKYNAHVRMTRSVLNTNFDLLFTYGSEAPSETYGKTRSYMDYLGIDGGALEMIAVDGTTYNGDGVLHTAKIMEADYTLLLQLLQMLIECQE